MYDQAGPAISEDCVTQDEADIAFCPNLDEQCTHLQVITLTQSLRDNPLGALLVQPNSATDLANTKSGFTLDVCFSADEILHLQPVL